MFRFPEHKTESGHSQTKVQLTIGFYTIVKVPPCTYFNKVVLKSLSLYDRSPSRCRNHVEDAAQNLGSRLILACLSWRPRVSTSKQRGRCGQVDNRRKRSQRVIHPRDFPCRRWYKTRQNILRTQSSIEKFLLVQPLSTELENRIYPRDFQSRRRYIDRTRQTILRKIVLKSSSWYTVTKYK